MLSTCQSAALFAESRRLVEQNRKLLRQSLQRMAHGRRHLHPRFAVSGGSDNASERTLGAMVRELLASGRLRPIDGFSWSPKRRASASPTPRAFWRGTRCPRPSTEQESQES